ncbi:hypothetical protein BJF86_03060 [Serinicoccus sp. CNJ-927]|nr:hypothetical protein BJF86_03060 [Serinicoccus sp. CNJ-927]
MEPEGILEVYSPRADIVDEATWRRLRPHVIPAVAKALPRSSSTTQNRLAFVTRYLQWCEANGTPLDPELIWTEDRIEAYLVTAEDPSVSTYRSHLRTVAKANAPSSVIWNVNPETFPRNQNRNFYSADQVRRLFRLVEQQATARRTFVLSATLHLGLAFGLRAGEMLKLCQDDVFEDDGLVVCRADGRLVPARMAYAEGVLEVVRSTDDDRVFGDHLLPVRTHEDIFKDVEFPRYLPRATPGLLRNTWMVDVLSEGRLTLPEFYEVPGLRSGSALDWAVPHLPLREETYLHRAAGEPG